MSGFSIIFCFFLKNKRLAVLGFCSFFAILGAWHYQITMEKISNNDFIKYNDKEESIILIGKTGKEADIREKSINLEIKSDYILINNEKIKVSGKVLITASRYPVYNYGDELEVTGKLKTPMVFEGFNYKDFLAKDGIFSVMYFPEVKKIGDKKGNFIFAEILFLKDKIRQSIYQNFSPPQSSLLGALILGDQRRMPDWFREKLNITGISHITSVSGMHVAILSAILMEFLLGLGFWRSQAFYITCIFLILFILMVGLPASAIRAGIMGGLFLFAQKIGRKSTAFRSIVFAAVVILIANPLLLRFDVSFQLSFLAVIGLIFLDPIFKKLLKKIPEKEFFNLRTMASMTFSAQLFTLPILIYNFGRISLISPITNILILPFIPLLTILGFLVGIVGIVSQTISHFLSFPCWLILTYMVKTIDWLSKFSFSYLNMENVSLIWLVIFYLILIFFVRHLNEKWKMEFLNY
ncbi:MAG: ComEC/Rec2 family competence protein [Candidatus Nealsonbacteria bacterium]|nr:ComEC/Rec2 family competence protein [Candidatus Nealsonbacteria bacterium]